MNTDNPSDSDNLKSFRVMSKYFTESTHMDESLSDFQEEKKTCIGPRQNKKTHSCKSKTRRTVKHIKGQNDIRNVLKKNKLLQYSKDFDYVCKKSGVDVNSEELQLAIALSKSLQSETKSSNESQSSESSSSHLRIRKIKATLQEYGFVIPEIKVATVNRGKKEIKKQYKLLLTSESEKQQIVLDKYSQVLFQNIDKSKEVDIDLSNACNAKLYHLCTNICYRDIKDNDIFYIGNLLEKCPRTIGCLLKDWSGIPGRPISPVFYEKPNMDISEIDCSQDELDTILSSSFKSTKEVLKKLDCKFIHKLENKTMNVIDDNVYQEIENHAKCDNNTIQLNEAQNNILINLETADTVVSKEKENVNEISDGIRKPQSSQNRSISPDIFEDEISVIDDTNHIVIQSLELTKTTREENKYMDLTACVDVVLGNKNSSFNYKNTQNINITRKKSNDFIEINCITNFSQPTIHKIDLTQDMNYETIETSATSQNNKNKHVYNMDVMQSSESSNDSLPFIQISGREKKTLQETHLLDENCIKINKMPVLIITDDDVITDNTGETISSSVKTIERCSTPSNELKIYDYLYNHSSSNSSKECLVSQISNNSKDNDNIDLTQTSNLSEETVNNRMEERQLEFVNETNSDISTYYDEVCNNKLENSLNHNYSDVSFSRNVCTDCDKIIDDRIESENQNSNCSVDYDIPAENDVQSVEIDIEVVEDMGSSSSKDFEVCDKEHNYSLHTSHQVLNNNFNLGGVSVIDNLSNAESFNKTKNVDNTTRNTNRSMSDSCLPLLEIGNNINTEENSVTKCRSEDSTPIKFNTDAIINIETPKNSTYIIKTDGVTPMLDYKSMSTPEMHQELNKYGLKPFKRKRAIQFLTHLYNQTHPTVEPYLEEQLSTPKRRKHESNSRNETRHDILEPSVPSGKTLKSPKQSPETSEHVDTEKTCGLYEVTNQVSIVKEIECNPEDWIFHKKDKAKVHTCRVPLHIAFHNYVTSRRALREAILRYDPVDIDVIHKGLKDAGHLYHPKDLLKFMDKKCITVKTNDNSSRNNRY